MKHLKRATALLCAALILAFATPLPLPRVYAASITCTPDANPETNSVDGRIINSDSSWATARSASAGTSANDSATIMNVTAQESGGTYFLYRSIIVCNTGPSIPDTMSVLATTLTLTSDTTRDGGEASSYIGIVGPASPASDTAIVAADFGSVGTTLISNTVMLSAWATGTSKDFTFTAAGNAIVSVTGKTKIGIKTGHDIANVAPGTGVESGIDIRTADHATPSSRPVLTITYGTPATPKYFFWIMYRAKPEPFFDFA